MEAMVRTSIPRNNFSSGIISQQLSGRFDLPTFANGVSFLENFNINLNGSLSKRTGFEIAGKNNTTENSFFFKFVFNQEQVYLLEFREKYFLLWLHTADDKLVLYNNGQHFSHPYALKDLENVKTSQNHDVIYFTHQNYYPQTLTRTYNTTDGTISFKFANVVIAGGTGTQNPLSIDGYPSSCLFFQNRMFYGGFQRSVNKIWASDTGYYNSFTTNRSNRDDIMDIDGFNFVLTELSLPILWLTATINGIVLGSSGGIALLRSESGSMTPFSFTCKVVNDDGANSKNPIIVGTTLIYIDNTLLRLKAINYSLNTDSYEATNLNILCPELINSNIKKIIYQQDENDYIYVLTEDGNIFYLLYSSLENFYSWGKIKTEFKVNYIEILERFIGGTNMFIIDEKNNIMRKSFNQILKKEEDFLTLSTSQNNLHELYYDYIDEVINNYNYLDLSTDYYYYNDTITLTYNKDYENEQGEFGTIIAFGDAFTLDEEELVSMTIRNRKTGGKGDFEIRKKISNSQIEVKVISKAISSNEITQWSFQKNVLDVDGSIYYNGNDFTIFGDGFYYKNINIVNGKIQLPLGIYIGHFKIGYNYIAILKTMNLGGMIDMSNTMIMKKNILKVYFRLYNSWGGQFGTDYYNLRTINFMKNDFARYGEAYTLEDYDVKMDMSDKWENNKYYFLVNDVPYPFNVNSISIVEDQN
jgi:hypothetical protein